MKHLVQNFTENFSHPDTPTEHCAALFLGLHEVALSAKREGIITPTDKTKTMWSQPYMQYQCTLASLQMPDKVLQLAFRTGVGRSGDLQAYDVVYSIFSDEQTRVSEGNAATFADSMGLTLSEGRIVWASLQEQHKKVKAFVPKMMLSVLASGFSEDEKLREYYEKILNQKVKKDQSVFEKEGVIAQKISLLMLALEEPPIDEVLDLLKIAQHHAVPLESMMQRVFKMCVDYKDAAGFQAKGAYEVEVKQLLAPVESLIEALELKTLVSEKKSTPLRMRL